MELVFLKLRPSLTTLCLQVLMTVLITEKSGKSAHGAIQGVVVVVVVHTAREDVTRIISARKATRKERKKYYEYLAQATPGT